MTGHKGCFGWVVVLLFFFIGGSAAGCKETSGGQHAAHAVGTVVVPLLTQGTSGEQYRLRGSAEITGASTMTLNLNPNIDVLSVELPPGAYILTLNDGWRIQIQQEDGSWQNVNAVLNGPNQIAFNVAAGEVTNVELTFLVGDEAISFGNGRVDVMVNVIDGPVAGSGGMGGPGGTGGTGGMGVCGDGILDPGEECDDGNAVDTDFCTSACLAASCGDGFEQNVIGEECDDGNQMGGDGCDPMCSIEVGVGLCGDGFLDPGEQCDDGNTDNTDLCTNTCLPASCGDGYVQAVVGEQCDDGNGDNTDGCTITCQLAVCGDGFVQPGEQCDDGNNNDSDACTNACQVAICGDGVVNWATEECDDGNADDDDYCHNDCTSNPVGCHPEALDVGPLPDTHLVYVIRGCSDSVSGSFFSGLGTQEPVAWVIGLYPLRPCEGTSCYYDLAGGSPLTTMQVAFHAGGSVFPASNASGWMQVADDDGFLPTDALYLAAGWNGLAPEPHTGSVWFSGDTRIDLDAIDSVGFPTSDVDVAALNATYSSVAVSTQTDDSYLGFDIASWEVFDQGPECGDGIIDWETEQCDDGNVTGGDGCDANCQWEVVEPTGEVIHRISGYVAEADHYGEPALVVAAMDVQPDCGSGTFCVYSTNGVAMYAGNRANSVAGDQLHVGDGSTDYVYLQHQSSGYCQAYDSTGVAHSTTEMPLATLDLSLYSDSWCYLNFGGGSTANIKVTDWEIEVP